MKLVTVATCLFCLNMFVSAQNMDDRLSQIYPKEELVKLKENSPKEYRLVLYALDNGCYVTKAPEGKTEGFTTSINWNKSTVPTYVELASEFGIKLENFNQYIRLNGTANMVVVKSRYVLENEISNQK
jgi:hypothetical protein